VFTKKSLPFIKGALAQLGERQTEASIRAALLQVSGSIPESAISFFILFSLLNGSALF
jgi:hypothetical protein